MTDGTENLCMEKSKAKWNFVRDFYCSLPKGHDGPHKAFWNHMADLPGQIAWLGPWEDGSFYDVSDYPEYEPWRPPDGED